MSRFSTKTLILLALFALFHWWQSLPCAPITHIDMPGHTLSPANGTLPVNNQESNRDIATFFLFFSDWIAELEISQRDSRILTGQRLQCALPPGKKHTWALPVSPVLRADWCTGFWGEALNISFTCLLPSPSGPRSPPQQAFSRKVS